MSSCRWTGRVTSRCSGSSRSCRNCVGSLARYSRVLWFDMRGIGLSDALVSPAAPEDWMDDVAAVMDAAGSERASLVAHGHAAQMALMSAATHPDRIESLVLVNGFARFSRAEDYPAGVPAGGRERRNRPGQRDVGQRPDVGAARPVRGVVAGHRPSGTAGSSASRLAPGPRSPGCGRSSSSTCARCCRS